MKRAIGGFVLIGLAFFGMYSNGAGPNNLSISRAHSLCSSGIGGIAQALDSKVAQSCGQYSAVWSALVVLALIGLGLLIWGLVTSRHNAHDKASA